jgi:hypothetical protein
VGPQLLRAVENLTNLLQFQQSQPLYQQEPEGFPLVGISSSVSNLIQEDRRIPTRHSHHHHYHYYDRNAEHPGSHSPKGVSNGRRPSQPAGLDSVLKWEIFPHPIPYMTLSEGSESNGPPSHSLPSMEYSELRRLEAKYVSYVHTKNPIMDLGVLHQLISQQAENGLDWSTRTCLICLVCALGALSRKYSPDKVGTAFSPQTFHSQSLSPGTPSSIAAFEGESQLAAQYWSVAAKRLGFVIGQNSLEAVQCLCLTGSV